MLDAYIIKKLEREKEEERWEPLPLTIEVDDHDPEIGEKEDNKEVPQHQTLRLVF